VFLVAVVENALRRYILPIRLLLLHTIVFLLLHTIMFLLTHTIVLLLLHAIMFPLLLRLRSQRPLLSGSSPDHEVAGHPG
jgi:hypothetical protein